MKKLTMMTLSLGLIAFIGGCAEVSSISVDSTSVTIEPTSISSVELITSSEEVTSVEITSEIVSSLVNSEVIPVDYEAELTVLFPDSTFTLSTVDLSTVTTTVGEVIEVRSGTNVISYVYEVNALGYKDATCIYLVGISPEGDFNAYAVIDLPSQTEGVGTQVTLESFYSQFLNQSITTSIAPITGATFTSGGLIDAIEIAVNHFTANLQ